MLRNKGKNHKKKNNNNVRGGKAKGRNTVSKPLSGITPAVRLPPRHSSVRHEGDKTIVTGTDFMHVLEMSETSDTRNFAGSVLFPQYVNPFRLEGTRLTQMANLFMRYKFRKFEVTFIPSVPATVAGQLVVCFDTDPTFAPLGDNQSIIRIMMAHKNVQMFHVFQRASINLPKTSRPDYYCDAQGQDIRVNNQAVLWAAVVSPVVTSEGERWRGAAGSFMVSYEVEFMGPRINNPTRYTQNTTLKLALVSGDVKYGRSFTIEGGAAPPTQTSVVIFRGLGGVVGLDRGTPYYLGGRAPEDLPPGSKPVYNIYGTLVGSQRRDILDIIDLDGVVTDLLECFWWPIGPESGARTAETNPDDVVTGLANGSQIGIVAANFENTNPKYQADEYLVRASGVVPREDDPGLDGASMIYENGSGETIAVEENEQLIFRNVSSEVILAKFSWTPAQFKLIFGVDPSVKRFIGVLLTATGFLVRVLTLATDVVRMSLAIKRELKESTEFFLSRINPQDPYFRKVLAGTHPGHQMRIEPRSGAA